MNYGEYETYFGRKIAIRDLEERMARQYFGDCQGSRRNRQFFGGRQGSRRRRESRSYRFGESNFDWNSDWQDNIPTLIDYDGTLSSIWYRLSPENKKARWANELAHRDTYRELNIKPDSNGRYDLDPEQPGYAMDVWEPTFLYFYENYMQQAGLT